MDYYDKILKKSLELSKPYWDLYDQLIASRLSESKDCDFSAEQHQLSANVNNNDDQHSSEHDDEHLNPAYLELIRVTREHQAKREKEKRRRQRKDLDVEVYYKDISQVDTLVEDNLVEAPDRHGKSSSSKQRQQRLIELYGGLEGYEQVRSMEMTIDEFFHRKCQQLKPGYWPVMPINHKRYLNCIES